MVKQYLIQVWLVQPALKQILYSSQIHEPFPHNTTLNVETFSHSIYALARDIMQ